MAKPYGLANQKLCYIQIVRNIEKSGEHDLERTEEWSVNTDSGVKLELDFILYITECEKPCDIPKTVERKSNGNGT